MVAPYTEHSLYITTPKLQCKLIISLVSAGNWSLYSASLNVVNPRTNLTNINRKRPWFQYITCTTNHAVGVMIIILSHWSGGQLKVGANSFLVLIATRVKMNLLQDHIIRLSGISSRSVCVFVSGIILWHIRTVTVVRIICSQCKSRSKFHVLF